ncbi:hypothetical protein LCGC14_0421890 [marine sediment metagenome]|uniref:Uncharacterized protein n=1 Tax=marine sediment metagenome TaxID=412755 RepID=A0A0F9SWM9_9ZZZZ
MVEAISTTGKVKAEAKVARHTVGDVVRARNLRVGDVVSVIDTNYKFQVVTKTFFEIIAVPIIEKQTDHRHRIQLLSFTQVVLLERL